MKNNGRIRRMACIMSYTLIMVAFWGVQYWINPHLVSAMAKVVVEYVCGAILCGIVSVWLNQRRNSEASDGKEV